MNDPSASSPQLAAVGDEKPSRALRQDVRARLERGEVVALPTETVYGLAVRADDAAAVQRLRALKGRPVDVGLTWHVTRRDLPADFAIPRAVVGRLVERYWPGPLTLVLPGVPAGLEGIAQDGWSGVRLPAHRATLGLLESMDFPVAVSSANRTGASALTSAADVQREFGSEVGLIVDGGASRLGRASEVLRVGNGKFELLRDGLLGIDDLRRTAGLRIGFVCTGNTCRSPMAEGIAREHIAHELKVEGDPGAADDSAAVARFGFHVTSMGVAAHPGSRAAEHAIDVLSRRGIGLLDHRSRPAFPEAVAELDRVYCLTASHRAALVSMLPPREARKVLLLDPAGRDIGDPIGGSFDLYARCADEITTAIDARMSDWV